jgi:hypothetical protein
MDHVKVLVPRVLILGTLWFVGLSTHVRADFCTDVCFPTCDTYVTQCEAYGGTITTLCGCQNNSGNYYCSLPNCQGGGGDECDGQGCSDACPQNCE